MNRLQHQRERGGVTRPRQEQRKGRQSRGRAATCCRGPARSRPAQHPAPGGPGISITYPGQCVEIIKFGTKCRLLRSAEGGYLLSGVSVLYMKCDLWHTVQTVECGGCGGGGGVSPSSVSRTRGSVSPGPAPSLAALVEGGPGNHSCHVVTHCYYTGHSILATVHL